MEHVENVFQIPACRDSRHIDEWKHDSFDPKFRANSDQPFELGNPRFAYCTFYPHQRAFHEIVRANRSDFDARLCELGLQDASTVLRLQRVGARSVAVENPLDTAQRDLPNQLYFRLPVRSRKRLQATVFRKRKPPLHRVQSGFGVRSQIVIAGGHSSIKGISMFARSSSRSRNGNKSSSGLDTILPSLLIVDDARGPIGWSG